MSKSKQYCSVYGCRSKYKSEENISLHSFPRLGSGKVNLINKHGTTEVVDRHTAWKIKLKMGKPITPNMKVCSNHFSVDSIFLPDLPCKRRVLKKNSVPSENLPMVKARGSAVEGRAKALLGQKRLERTERREQRKLITATATITSADQDAADALVETPMQVEVVPPMPSAIHMPLPIGSADVGIQITSGDIVVPFVTAINTTKQLNTLTGLPSFEHLNVLCTEVTKVFSDKRIHRLTIKERIILTMIKLKQNFSFSVLSVLFGTVTVQTCKTIFLETLTCLARILKSAIPWPSKVEIMNKMPKCFEKFKNTRIVLDCTEISVQKPKCLVCRLKLYSHYKSGLTLKFMTGVTPAGLISYTSPAYGGKASDKAIFVQSGLLDKLEHGDAVMVDKGFLIDDVCFKKGIKIIRPPFLQNKQQFSREEALLNREIAAARVHIERSNQRIKIFKFLNSRYEWSLLNLINDAFTVVCGITNLCSPILGDDKF